MLDILLMRDLILLMWNYCERHSSEVMWRILKGIIMEKYCEVLLRRIIVKYYLGELLWRIIVENYCGVLWELSYRTLRWIIVKNNWRSIKVICGISKWAWFMSLWCGNSHCIVLRSFGQICTRTSFHCFFSYSAFESKKMSDFCVLVSAWSDRELDQTEVRLHGPLQRLLWIVVGVSRAAQG